MEQTQQKIVERWWQSMALPPDQLREKGVAPPPSGCSSALRRCESAEAAMLTEGFRRLWLQLSDDITQAESDKHIQCWATIAAVLVHIKRDGKLNLAQAAGKRGKGDKSIVNEMRFAQLQTARSPEEFLRRLRRIVQQVQQALQAYPECGIKVVSVAQDIHQWFNEHYQFHPRKGEKRIAVRWAMDYFQAAGQRAS